MTSAKISLHVVPEVMEKLISWLYFSTDDAIFGAQNKKCPVCHLLFQHLILTILARHLV